MHIFVTGATGFIGSALGKVRAADEVVVPLDLAFCRFFATKLDI